MAVGGITPVGIDPTQMVNALPQYQSLGGVQGVPQAGGPSAPSAVGGVQSADATPSFGSMIADKLNSAVDLQNQGAVAAQSLATGTATDISAATIAVQKASISLQLVGAFRNKALEAYQDVMRMQV